MLELFQSINESFENPQRAHAALVHTPIALAFLGLIPLLLVVATRGRSERMRWLCVAVYVLAAATAFVASGSGERALGELDQNAYTDEALAVITKHEEMGEAAFWFLAGTAVAVALSAAPWKWWRVVTLIASLGLGVFAAGWIMATAHHGGTLVYQHGVGVPRTVNNIVPPESLKLLEGTTEEASAVEGSTDDEAVNEDPLVESEHVGTATAPATQPVETQPEIE